MDTEKKNQIDLAPYGTDAKGNANLPNPTQLKVLKWVDDVRNGKHVGKGKDGIPVLFLKGGVGSGKTRGLLAPACEMLLESPGIRMLWGRQDFKDLKLSAMDTFLNVIPQEVITDKSEQYHWYDIWTGKKKAPGRLYFNGLRDISGLGSQEFAVIIVTEAHEITEMSYRALKRRCRQAGYPVMILMESEPPNESHWLERITNSANDEYDQDIEVWELSTYENWENLPAAYRNSLEGMPKAWQRKYLYGKAGFIPDGRPFYEGFREEVHTGEYGHNTEKLLIGSWDFGFHHPAFTVHQMDDSGRWYVLAELMGNEITIDKFCEQVKLFINSRFADGKFWKHYGDPACMQKNDKSEKTSWKICDDHGFRLTIKQSTYRARKEIIDGKLSKMINGKPMMLVDRSCRTLIDGLLGGYHYPERVPGHPVSAGDEIPVKDGYYEHICLHGDTLVRALDGWHKISDLVGKEFITYAYSAEAKRIVPAKAMNCRKTQGNAELWRLVHDKGELFATPEHPIMMRDGTFRPLRDLKENDELMPFYEKQRSKKGHTVINLNDGSIVDEHRYIYNWFNGNLREAHHIHHKDVNPRNNYPDNLEQKLATVHMAEVYSRNRIHRTEKGGCVHDWSEESRKKVGFWSKKNAFDSRVEKKCEVCGSIYMGLPRQKHCSVQCGYRAAGARRRAGTSMPRFADKVCLNCGKEFKGMSISKYCTRACGAQYSRKSDRLELVNHKVISVGYFGCGDVYNLEVENHHNFPANGIFVHNCNTVEYVAINLFKAIEKHPDEERKRREGRYSYRNGGGERKKNVGFAFSGAHR